MGLRDAPNLEIDRARSLFLSQTLKDGLDSGNQRHPYATTFHAAPVYFGGGVLLLAFCPLRKLFSPISAQNSLEQWLGVNEPLQTWFGLFTLSKLLFNFNHCGIFMFPDLPPNAQQMSNRCVNALMMFKSLF